MIIEINSKQEVLKILKTEAAALVYFYNNNCAPCISLRPKVEELISESFPKMKLVFVNSEKHMDITASYNVFSNPTLIIFFEGREYRRESKYISISQLSESIERPYNMIFE
ncbi:MAG: thioredoxin family protein [Bacteroidetes bacterium]|nr:thioredoxin family protein [Bacteroidota bacterium]